MELKLAENIRKFRKERSLTQEQLSQVMGVTVGAVYKWESGLSVPDICLIMDLADFFDTSVDVLLGYTMKDNHLESCVRRLKEYRCAKDRSGLMEAEKALKKYPHVFDIVHESAKMFRLFGIEDKNKAVLSRALELIEQSFLLLPQNANPEVDALTLYGEMASVYLALEQTDQAMELLKKHNANGLFNSQIGLALSDCKPKEALPYLSNALLDGITTLIQAVTGYQNVFFDQKDDASAQAILQWGLTMLSGLKTQQPCFLDKVSGMFLVCLAASQLRSGQKSEAKHSLERARALAAAFDAAPCYDVTALRFVDKHCKLSAGDDLGATALDGLEQTVAAFESDALSALWAQG